MEHGRLVAQQSALRTWTAADVRLIEVVAERTWSSLKCARISRPRAEQPALVGRLGFVTGTTLGPDAVRFLVEAGRPTLKKPLTPAGLRAFVARLRGK